jgi:hypothetical protein
MKQQLIQWITVFSVAVFILIQLFVVICPTFSYFEAENKQSQHWNWKKVRLEQAESNWSSDSCPELNLSTLLLPIVLNGFNNQINSLYHGILIADILGRTMIEPQFYTHETCNSSKRSFAFEDALQWTEDFKANHQILSFEVLKQWIACNNVTEIETDIVYAKYSGYNVLQQIKRAERDLNVKFVRVKVEELTREFMNSTSNFFEANGLAGSPRLVLTVAYGYVKGFYGRPYGKNPLPVNDVLTSLKFSESSLTQARDVLAANNFSHSICFVHFRPFADKCVRIWPGPGSEEVCSNLKTLKHLLDSSTFNSSKERECDYYVAYPEFLSKEGQYAVMRTIQPKMTTADLAAKYPHLGCFELSLLEQNIAFLSNTFQGSGSSSWTDTVNIFRKMKNS